MIKALGMSGFDATAERLLLHHLSTPPEGAAFEGVVLIAGASRSGKSTVAKKLAEALRIRTLSTDGLEALYTSRSPAEADAARRTLLSQICGNAQGLVLEGWRLNQMSDPGADICMADLGLDPERLNNGAIRFYVVGCCDSSVECWTKVLQTHGGWLRQRDEATLMRWAKSRPQRNRHLRDWALSSGLPYFEIPREDFTAAVESTAAAIVADVRQNATH